MDILYPLLSNYKQNNNTPNFHNYVHLVNLGVVYLIESFHQSKKITTKVSTTLKRFHRHYRAVRGLGETRVYGGGSRTRG